MTWTREKLVTVWVKIAAKKAMKTTTPETRQRISVVILLLS